MDSNCIVCEMIGPRLRNVRGHYGRKAPGAYQCFDNHNVCSECKMCWTTRCPICKGAWRGLRLSAQEFYPRPPQARKMEGDKAFEAGNLEEAIELYSEALQLDPDYSEAQKARDNCFMKIAEYENFYNILGVNKKSNAKEVQIAYRRKVSELKNEIQSTETVPFRKNFKMEILKHIAQAYRNLKF